ncbi:MAG: molecular chaperone [Cypionkella sp.]|uniref:fimbrial biogenesis chaperone n=1 Tax=Cypionkella sp. TaxID=2811411 RepID=UPI0026359992|nr:molecular chaperone [Cypionkella sp.]MDB5658752.1 molecular chaperone [Cypionkella sp.]
MKRNATILGLTWASAGLLALLTMLASGQAALAEGLRVSPVTIEVTAPGATSTLALRNDGPQAITIQARVYRWVQEGGEERYEPTRDVVVSPPMTRLKPGAKQSVRIVRTTKTRVNGEEAYRVFVDEVPDLSRSQAGTVAFVTRLRIPVFFVASGARLPEVRWSLTRDSGRAVLEAKNTGDVRLRLADVELVQGGGTVDSHKGLFGYVLGGASMRFPLGSASKFRNGPLSLQAVTSRGPLSAAVSQR